MYKIIENTMAAGFKASVLMGLIFLSVQCSTHFEAQLQQGGIPSGLYVRRHQFEKLKIEANISDISWVRDCRRLKSLEVNSTNLIRIGPLPKSLTHLTLRHGQVSGTAEARDLTALSFYDNKRRLSISDLDNSGLKELEILNCGKIDSNWPNMPMLEKLKVQATFFDEIDFKKFPKLLELDISIPEAVNLKISKIDLNWLELKVLTLSNAEAPNLPTTLTTLNLNRVNFSRWPSFKELESLTIVDCPSLFKTPLPELPKLKHLSLTGDIGDNFDFASLSTKAPQLKSLTLENVSIDISNIANLKISSLALINQVSKKEYFENLASPFIALASLPLRELTIEGTPYKDVLSSKHTEDDTPHEEWFNPEPHQKVIEGLKNLRVLKLAKGTWGDLNVNKLEQLEKLYLSGLFTKEIYGIKNCKKLTYISIDDCENLATLEYENLPQSLQEMEWKGKVPTFARPFVGDTNVSKCSFTLAKGKGNIVKLEVTVWDIDPSIWPSIVIDLKSTNKLKVLTLKHATLADLSEFTPFTTIKELILNNIRIKSLNGMPNSVTSLSYISPQ